MNNGNLLLKDLNTKHKMDQLAKQKDEIKSSLASVFNGEENVNEINSKLESIVVEDLQHMTDEKVDEILTVQGEVLQLPEQYMDVIEDQYAFKKDLIKYMIEAEKTTKEIETAEEELDKFIKENEEEIEKILASHEGSMIKAIREDIVSRETVANTDDLKAVHSTILNAFDDSFTVNRIFDIYSKLNKENTLNDYRVNFRNVYNQYNVVRKRLNVRFDLHKFGGLEKKFLEEKYQAYPNLFVFIVMKYIGKRNSKIDTAAYNDGVFASQLATNLYLLFTDSLEEEYKEIFLNSIRRILDIYVG